METCEKSLRTPKKRAMEPGKSVGIDHTSRVKSTNPDKVKIKNNYHRKFSNHSNFSKSLDRLWANDAKPNVLDKMNIIDVVIAMKAEYEVVKKRYGLREECKDAKEIARQVMIILIVTSYAQ